MRTFLIVNGQPLSILELKYIGIKLVDISEPTYEYFQDCLLSGMALNIKPLTTCIDHSATPHVFSPPQNSTLVFETSSDLEL